MKKLVLLYLALTAGIAYAAMETYTIPADTPMNLRSLIQSTTFIKAVATFETAVEVNGRANCVKVAFGATGKDIIVIADVETNVSIELTEVE